MIWADAVLQGILLGGLYALFAAGLALVFGVMKLVNLAHGDLIVLAAFVILFVTDAARLNPFLAALLAAPLMFGVGWLLQRALLDRVLGTDLLRPLLVTFGLSVVIQNGLLEAFSADSRRLSLGGLEASALQVGPLTLGLMPLLTFAAAVGVILALNAILYRTPIGRAFRATADDPDTVALQGIAPRRVFAVCMGLALVIVTIAALFLGARANFDPSIGPARLIFAFEAVIIGGLGSMWGTLAGGIVIGIAQTVGATINPEWQILAGHLVFLAVLMVRPRGLFPGKT